MDKIFLRECIECKQFLPLGEFYASIDKKTGREARYSRCKKCLAKRRMDVATGKIVPKGKHLDPERMMKNVELDDLVILAQEKHMSYGEYMQYLYKQEGHYC